MKYYIEITCFLLATVLLSSCVNEQIGVDDQQRPAVIVNNPAGALPGELLIKFRPELTDLLDQAGLTKAGSDDRKLERLGITTVDELMDAIGGYEFERVFPVDARHEERTRKEGLHLWYVVRFDEDTDVIEAAQKLSRLGELSKIEYSREMKRSYACKAVPFKSDAEPDGAVFNDPGLQYQWHYINNGGVPELDHNFLAGADVNCKAAWDKCAGDPSIIVAVMDEGVMWSHPDLAANMWVNEPEQLKSDEDADNNGYVGDRYGFNFVDNTGVISWSGLDDTGHGTHVAGTIAAVNNNGEGVCGIAGGSGNNDGVKIMSLQIFSGNRGVSMENQVKAVKYAADNGAVVLQCSWGYMSAMANPLDWPGGGFYSDEEYEEYMTLEKESFDYFIHHAGTPNGVIDGGIVVFAAGNEYAAMASYPGAHKDFICVSAVAADYTPSAYSNYGPGVDVAAPGGDMDYHKSSKGGVLSTLPSLPSGGEMYGYMEGTSMSCPHVSGVVALGLSYATKLRRHFNSREFKDLVISSARNIDEHLTGTKLYNFRFEDVGENCPTLVDLSTTYKGKMGGMVDLGLLFSAIEGSQNVVMFPNVYVSVDQERQIDASKCFASAADSEITASCADGSVATVSVSGSIVSIKGVKEGRTSLTVGCGTEEQTVTITVRNGVQNNGWL